MLQEPCTRKLLQKAKMKHGAMISFAQVGVGRVPIMDMKLAGTCMGLLLDDCQCSVQHVEAQHVRA